MTDLREQVRGILDAHPGLFHDQAGRAERQLIEDAVLAVVAERERELRGRIEALRDEPHTPPPCRRAHTAEDAYRRVLAVLNA